MANNREIKALTGLRGISALGVVLFHYWFADWISVDTISGNFCARGYIFVDMFFMLSGFVMSKAYAQRFLRDWNGRVYVRFIAVRLARIYPIYIVLLLVAVFFALVHPLHAPILSPKIIIANVLLIQSWLGMTSTIGTAWSLSTEWLTYIIFPTLVWLVLRSNVITARLSAIIAGVAVIAIWLYDVMAGNPLRFALDVATGWIPFVRCFAGFIIGMGVYRLAESGSMRFAGDDRFVFGLVAVILGLWLSRNAPDVLIYALFPVLIFSLSLNMSHSARLLSCRPIWLIGEWSYSIYLIHIFVLRGRAMLFDIFSRYMPNPIADALDAIALFTITITLSAACFTLIEAPARRYLRPLIQTRRMGIEGEPSAP